MFVVLVAGLLDSLENAEVLPLSARLCNYRHQLSIGLLFLTVACLGMWMHALQITEAGVETPAPADDDPSYFMKNVVVTGKYPDGNRYRIEAARLVHYSSRNGSSLQLPKITQYMPDGTIRSVAANKGWLDKTEQTLNLSENARIQNRSAHQANSSSVTDQLTIHLNNQGDHS